jgi:hypothetical protein
MNPKFKDGLKAFSDGLGLQQNPCKPHTDDYMAWEDGWKLAQGKYTDKWLDDPINSMS